MEGTKTSQGSEKPSLSALSGYISGLWKLGGLPLVLVGLGAANLFVPNFAGYGQAKQFVLTAGLFLAGLVTWVSVTVLAYRRWHAEAQIASDQDAKLLETVAQILAHTTSDAAAKERSEVLKSTYKEIRARQDTSPTR